MQRRPNLKRSTDSPIGVGRLQSVGPGFDPQRAHQPPFTAPVLAPEWPDSHLETTGYGSRG